MKAKEAYKNILIELDKYESPTFEVEDFNYFINRSINAYVSKNYGNLDIIQKELDDVQALIQYSDEVDLTISGVSVEDDYQHILNVQAKMKFIAKYGANAVDSLKWFRPKRMPTNRKNKENAYFSPEGEDMFYELNGNKIHVLFDDAILEPSKLKYMYLRKPKTMYLNPDTGVDYELEQNNTTFEFPDYAVYEILAMTRSAFLENIESRRYSSSLQEESRTP